MSYSGTESPAGDSYEDPNDRGTSVVDRNSDVEGTYTTTRDLRVEGRLTGSIDCQGVLFIADGAEVDAEVDAASIIVSGTLRGKIRCSGRLEITSTGSVGGEVDTASLVIVEGARYEGTISMLSIVPEAAPELEATGEPEPQTDAYSLLRRYASTTPESRDDSPASSTDADEDEAQ
jgi:cytoskeletal protein CcmA (bactofilin family)